MEVISTIDEGRPGGGLFRFVGSGFQLALGNVRWLTTRKFVVLVCCSTESSLVTVVKPLHTLWCCVLLVPCSITSPLEGRPRRDNEVLDERGVGVRGQPEPTTTPSSCGATTMTAASEVCLGGDLARQSFFEVVSSGISLMARLHFGRWTTTAAAPTV